MIFTALTPRFRVNPGDFSVKTGNALSDVAAKYNIFGRANNITLTADKLSIELFDLVPGDYPTVIEIVKAVDNGFTDRFPESTYTNISVQSFEHCEIKDGTTIEKYLSQFSLDHAEQMQKELNVIYTPSARIELKSVNQSWDCSLLVERSALLAEGVFAAFHMNMRDISQTKIFDEKLALVATISAACFRSLGLESENV